MSKTLVACLAFTASISVGSVPTSVPVKSQTGEPAARIAFALHESGHADIYVMDADGSSQTRLTDSPGPSVFPSWSPDGAKIAFTSVELPSGTHAVYVMNADGSNLTKLKDNGSLNVSNISPQGLSSWSPDGTEILFQDADDSTGIYVMAADGSDQRRLASGGIPLWSPDGARIVFFRDQDIFVMDADGGHQRNLTNSSASDFFPSWSPDSQEIVFLSDRDSPGGEGPARPVDIYVMDADGGNPTRLTDDPGDDGYASWSPDGARFVFQSDRAGNVDIYVMDADGSNQTNLTQNPAPDLFPSWAPDGRHIMFLSPRDGDFGIYVMDADGRHQTRLASGEGAVWSPRRD